MLADDSTRVRPTVAVSGRNGMTSDDGSRWGTDWVRSPGSMPDRLGCDCARMLGGVGGFPAPGDSDWTHRAVPIARSHIVRPVTRTNTHGDPAIREFWAAQVSSLHRSDSSDFYQSKALEHSNFMEPAHRRMGVADFATGAGELLAPFAELVVVESASDASASMLARASERTYGSGIRLEVRDGLNAATLCTSAVWTTCGGLNQYLDPVALSTWLRRFADSTSAQAMYLFDTVDPLRSRTLRPASLYVERTRSARSLLASVRSTSLAMIPSRRQWRRLGSASMGYGYLPGFFREECRALGLDVRFGSSTMYEYRFHSAITKRHT